MEDQLKLFTKLEETDHQISVLHQFCFVIYSLSWIWGNPLGNSEENWPYGSLVGGIGHYCMSF